MELQSVASGSHVVVEVIDAITGRASGHLTWLPQGEYLRDHNTLSSAVLEPATESEPECWIVDPNARVYYRLADDYDPIVVRMRREVIRG